MKIQEIFQGTFKLISIMAQFFYLRRQTVESATHGTKQLPGSEIFWIIIPYLCLTKFLQVILCYCFYIWTEQLIRGAFNLDASICCWFSGMNFPFPSPPPPPPFWWGGGGVVQFLPVMLKDQESL